MVHIWYAQVKKSAQADGLKSLKIHLVDKNLSLKFQDTWDFFSVGRGVLYCSEFRIYKYIHLENAGFFRFSKAKDISSAAFIKIELLLLEVKVSLNQFYRASALQAHLKPQTKNSNPLVFLGRLWRQGISKCRNGMKYSFITHMESILSYSDSCETLFFF